MGLSVNTNGSQTTTIGTEHTLATITTANVFELVLDVNALASGTTPDILEATVYLKESSGGTERLLKTWTIGPGVQEEKEWKSPPVSSAVSYRVTIKQTQGSSRSIPWAVWQLQ